MSFEKFKSTSYGVGRRHPSATTNFYDDTTFDDSKVVIGPCSICYRKNAMIVNDNTTQAESLGDFFKNLGKNGLNVSKKKAKNVLENAGQALDITANNASVAVSRNPKAALSTLLEFINFLVLLKVYISEKFCYFRPSKWNRKQKDLTHLHH